MPYLLSILTLLSLFHNSSTTSHQISIPTISTHPSFPNVHQYCREYYAPGYSSSNTYHSGTTYSYVPKAIPQIHNAPRTASPSTRNSVSSVSSVTETNPTPLNHALKFIQDQLDDLKQESLKAETEKSMQMEQLQMEKRKSRTGEKGNPTIIQ